MFGYNRIGHAPILNQTEKTGTYFSLLPIELWIKVQDYYYDLISLYLDQYGNGTAYFTLDKYISSNEGFHLLDAKFILDLPIEKLIATYNNPAENIFYWENITISWQGDHTLIGSKQRLYLHNHLSQLFWQKIKRLNDIVMTGVLTDNEALLENITI